MGTSNTTTMFQLTCLHVDGFEFTVTVEAATAFDAVAFMTGLKSMHSHTILSVKPL